jgi:signal transduction histidine kinase
MKAKDSWAGEGAFVADALHALSQPVTALECGLELSLRQDETVAEMRNRMEALRETAQTLHRRLLELRALQDAADAGDTATPVTLHALLENLQADFSPVAKLARVALQIRCRPAQVFGNAGRLRSGFFHLLEFLMRQCPGGGSVSVTGRAGGAAIVEITFRACAGADGIRSGSANGRDLDWRIAERTFAAAGGRMEMLSTESTIVTGVVTLQCVAQADDRPQA